MYELRRMEKRCGRCTVAETRMGFAGTDALTADLALHRTAALLGVLDKVRVGIDPDGVT
jgi:hypothetical protein